MKEKVRIMVLDKLTKWASDIQAIAQTGLAYTRDIYDKERYQHLLQLSAQMIAELSHCKLDNLPALILDDKGYATPKIDIRVFLLDSQQRVLMVQESQDGLWSLPGGWADVNLSPKHCAIKEMAEETGLEIEISRLLALWDKLLHDHPPHWPHTYKCIFAAKQTGGTISPNHEVLAIDYFSKENLPPLSTHRITKSQIIKLYDLMNNQQVTQFD